MPLARKTVTGTSCLRTCPRKVSWRACGCAAVMIGLLGRPHTCWPTVPLSAQRPTPEHHSARVPCPENGAQAGIRLPGSLRVSGASTSHRSAGVELCPGAWLSDSLRRVHGIRAYRSAEKNGEWLTLSEAAAKLGVSHHRMRALVKAGVD